MNLGMPGVVMFMARLEAWKPGQPSPKCPSLAELWCRLWQAQGPARVSRKPEPSHRAPGFHCGMQLCDLQSVSKILYHLNSFTATAGIGSHNRQPLSLCHMPHHAFLLCIVVWLCTCPCLHIVRLVHSLPATLDCYWIDPFPFVAMSPCPSHPKAYGLDSSIAPIMPADIKIASNHWYT